MLLGNPEQTSKMELFTKVDVSYDSEYASSLITDHSSFWCLLFLQRLLLADSLQNAMPSKSILRTLPYIYGVAFLGRYLEKFVCFFFHCKKLIMNI